MADNYRISRDRAQQFFLQFDQQALIEAWNLPHDTDYLYVTFFGRSYRICRRTGVVHRPNGEAADYDETLSIFDLLCHASPVKCLCGSFAPVNSLKGRPAIGVGTDFHSETARRFDRNLDAFQSACLALGGQPMALGDLGFSFPVFGDLTVRLKFYRSDEEFPASVVLLWDENTLQYVYYETVFYLAGFLLCAIQQQMDVLTNKEESL